MYNNQALLKKLSGIVGIRASLSGSEELAIDSDLQVSKSGLYANDDALLSTETLYSAARILNVSPAAYNANISYPVGSLVTHENKVWRNIESVVSIEPGSNEKWVQTNVFSHWLRTLRGDAITQALSDLLSYRLSTQAGKILRERTALFSQQGSETITPQGRFVGFRVGLERLNLAAAIQLIGLQFMQNQALTLHIYHSSTPDRVATIEVEYNNQGRFYYKVLEDEIVLNDSTGVYLIGYYESDLNSGNKAYNAAVRVWNVATCLSCYGTALERQWRKGWSDYIDVVPITVEAGKLPQNRESWRWTLDDLDTALDTNFGLNLTFVFKCDLTDFFGTQAMSFANLIQKGMAHRLMKAVASPGRQNIEKAMATEFAIDMVHNKDNAENTYQAYQQEIKNLSYNFEQKGQICLPVVAKPRIQYGTV